MGKDVSFPAKRPSQTSSRAAEAFASLQPQPEPKKRLTLDIPLSLHSRIKFQCVKQNVSITETVQAILERHFPEEPNQG